MQGASSRTTTNPCWIPSASHHQAVHKNLSQTATPEYHPWKQKRAPTAKCCIRESHRPTRISVHTCSRAPYSEGKRNLSKSPNEFP